MWNALSIVYIFSSDIPQDMCNVLVLRKCDAIVFSRGYLDDHTMSYQCTALLSQLCRIRLFKPILQLSGMSCHAQKFKLWLSPTRNKTPKIIINWTYVNDHWNEPSEDHLFEFEWGTQIKIILQDQPCTSHTAFP